MKIRFAGGEKIGMFLVAICFAVAIFCIGIVFMVQKSGEKSICGIDQVAQKQTALVLGARVYDNGRMSDIFRDRVDMAIMLYKSGKVSKILVSGDHGHVDYDEVNTAKDYLLAQGVKDDDIFIDHAGFDTYDSMYRAREIFQVRSLIIVTQEYHLPRALYISQKLGMDAVGVPADLHVYGGEGYRNMREYLADIKAFFDIALKAKPRFLGEAIPIMGSGFASWDENKP